MKNSLFKLKAPFFVLSILLVLSAAFLWGQNDTNHSPAAPSQSSASVSPSSPETSSSASTNSQAASLSIAPSSANTSKTPDPVPKASPSVSSEKTASPDTTTHSNEVNTNKQYSEDHGMSINADTGKDQYQTTPVPVGKPIPVEAQDTKITDKQLSCTLSVRCDSLLHNMDFLSKDKHELVPKDGIILPATQVTFYEGESVFNVLQREMKRAKIHMEYENTPIYNSAYIEGINNLYEFDAGNLSGWMYKVNDWFPNYGCSRYQLQEGDIVEWVYTCNLGKDVGG